MCIKNDDCNKLLGIFRKIEKEGLSSISKTEVCESLVLAKVLSEEIEKHFDNLKDQAKKLSVEKEIFADYGKKVVLKEGSGYTSYDTEWIGKELNRIGKVTDFFKIVNVVKKKVEELNNDSVTQIVNQCSKTDIKESSISVLKLTKDEIKETLK